MPPERVEGGHRAAAGSASPQLSTAARTQPDLSELLAQVARPEPDEDAWQSSAFPGQVVGRFELLRELGRGGFGVVFEARDRELGRLVAFKAVRPGTRASSAQRVEWLRREAEATAQLNHENIVALYDAGRTERGPLEPARPSGSPPPWRGRSPTPTRRGCCTAISSRRTCS